MTDLTFNLQFSLLTYILLGVAVVLAVWVCWLYAGAARRVARAVRRDTAVCGMTDGPLLDKNRDDGRITLDADGEPVSVIVRACDDAGSLAEILPDILAQEYAPGFEVIVVNEGASEAAMRVVDGLRATHSNLYVTFTPDRSLNLSSKKLAVTLGVKAARNRVVVLTAANAGIRSKHWLQRMAAHFRDPDIEVVLGYAGPDADSDKDTWRRTRAFNHVETAVGWLYSALRHRPLRGTEYNMAFTTEAFFRNKGFSRSLNLVEGVDDIFVNEIATPQNTAVELARQAMTSVKFDDPAAGMRADRRSHRFTGRFLSRKGGWLFTAGPLGMLVAIAAAVLASVEGWPNLLPLTVAVVTVLVMLTVTVLSWRSVMIALYSRRLLLTLPWMVLSQPLRAMVYALRSRSRKHGRNYTFDR